MMHRLTYFINSKVKTGIPKVFFFKANNIKLLRKGNLVKRNFFFYLFSSHNENVSLF